jgi:putative endonuclease
MNRKQQIGKDGESAAAEFLKKKGYKILEQNYRSSLGEIDIIAEDRKTIAFIEVKTRGSMGYGSPKSAITPEKQRKISMVALLYLKKNSRMNARARFDVVTIRWDSGDIHLIKNAFELAYP